MKTIYQVLEQLQEVGVEQYGYEVLSLWGKEIIEECAGNFECTMESAEPDEDDSYELFNGTFVKPVLIRSSILAVKEKIK